jgi:ankyrin repeat protein
MPPRPLPNNPSLERLRKIAKRLRTTFAAGDAEAVALVREFYPRDAAGQSQLTLADAQLAIARSHGYASWTKLKQHLSAIEPFVWNEPPPPDPRSQADVFIRLACLTYTGLHPSPARAARMLTDAPALTRIDISTAAAAGDVSAVATMLDADPTIVNRKGGPLRWEPLLYACYSRVQDPRSTLDVARFLLSRGADPNAGFLYDAAYAFTALTGAFGRGEDWPNQPPHPQVNELARLLLEAGADPNDLQALYNRHFGSDNTHLEILFAHGLGRDKRGRWLKLLNDPPPTPRTLLAAQMGWAVEHGFFDRVKLLVEHGVDVNVRSARSNRTPYEEAVRAGHERIAEYLLQHGASKVELDPLETFALACIAGKRDDVRARLAADPTLLERLGHERRIDMLHRAVGGGRTDAIRLVVELGVDIDGMVPGTGCDRTVLHNAAAWNTVDMVKLLIEFGANPRLRDLTYHGTALGWALYNNRHHPDVVDYLLQFATIFEAVQSGAVERAVALLRDDPALADARDDQDRPLAFHLNPESRTLGAMIRALVEHGVDVNARDQDGLTLLERAQSRGLDELADLLRASVPLPRKAP